MRKRQLIIPIVLLAAGVAGAAEPEKRATITLAEAQPLFAQRITVTGRVQPLVTARVGARVSGHIAAIGTDESGAMLDAGMRVKAGQVLLQVDRTTFENHKAVAEAGLRSAQAAMENLTAPTREERLEALRQVLKELETRIADRKRDSERFQRLVEQEKTLPARRLEEVQTELEVLLAQRAAATARLREAENGPTKTEIAVAQARVREAETALKIAEDDLRDTMVRAPFDGVITMRLKSPGDYVNTMPLVEVFELVSMDRLEAELRLPEAYYASVEAGKTEVRLRSPLLKEDLAVTVSRVVAQIDPSKGTFPVRVSIPADRRGGLAAGAFVTAEVAVADGAGAAVVPQRAVVEADGKAFVFVAQDGRLVKRPVQLGDRLTEGVVVKSGVRAGEKVAVGTLDGLKDGETLPDVVSNAK